MNFYIVDAFTDKIFGGNPAGVVYLPEGSSFPSDEIMIKTAAELRYSETAFILKISEFEFQTRYFTPSKEVDLCGHATIGSFAALLYDGIIKNNQTYSNLTLAGKLNVSVENNFIMMDMKAPEFLGIIKEPQELNSLYSIMGLNYALDSVNYEHSPSLPIKWFPEIISTGLPDIIMPVASREALERITPDFEALADLSEKYKVVGVHAFCLGDNKITAYCRNFAPLYAIDEEAATGTSNGALTYFLYKKKMLKDDVLSYFTQGEALGRPSKIASKLSCFNDNFIIKIGGTAKILVKGEINL